MMYDDVELLALAATDLYLCEDCDEGTDVLIGPEVHYIEEMASIVKVVMLVSVDTEFKEESSAGKISLNVFGRKVLQAINIESHDIVVFFENNKLSPYLYAFDRARQHLKKDGLVFFNAISEKPSRQEALVAVESFVGAIKAEAASAQFRRYMRSYERAVTKNSVTVNEHVDALFGCYSRMVVIRLDLGYSREYCASLTGVVSIERVKKDFVELNRIIKRGRLKGGICGFVWKLEFGPVKQFHYHWMIFLDGSKFREDVTIAKEIGEIWKNIVTGGDGCYFNCNARKHLYRYPALGMIKWDSVVEVDNVKRAASYLVKLDLLVRPNLLGGERTFGKSGSPSKKSLAGRPRQS
jgi:hypothetical protein